MTPGPGKEWLDWPIPTAEDRAVLEKYSVLPPGARYHSSLDSQDEQQLMAWFAAAYVQLLYVPKRTRRLAVAQIRAAASLDDPAATPEPESCGMSVLDIHRS